MKPEHQLAWGSPIKEAHADKTLTVPRNTEASLVSVPKPLPNTEVKGVISRLKVLVKVIEDDIAYFLLHPGQSMAANNLSFVKRNILDNVASLEKACLNP